MGDEDFADTFTLDGIGKSQDFSLQIPSHQSKIINKSETNLA